MSTAISRLSHSIVPAVPAKAGGFTAWRPDGEVSVTSGGIAKAGAANASSATTEATDTGIRLRERWSITAFVSAPTSVRRLRGGP